MEPLFTSLAAQQLMARRRPRLSQGQPAPPFYPGAPGTKPAPQPQPSPAAPTLSAPSAPGLPPAAPGTLQRRQAGSIAGGFPLPTLTSGMPR